MITIMTKDEYEMVGTRRVIEESKMVFIYNEKGGIDLKKNAFGRAANDLSMAKFTDLIKAYFKIA